MEIVRGLRAPYIVFESKWYWWHLSGHSVYWWHLSGHSVYWWHLSGHSVLMTSQWTLRVLMTSQWTLGIDDISVDTPFLCIVKGQFIT